MPDGRGWAGPGLSACARRMLMPDKSIEVHLAMTGFLDARLLLERANKHSQELFDECRKLWRLETEAKNSQDYRHRITFNRAALPKLRPIVADVANNLRHALDHLAAEAARQHFGTADLDHRIRQKIKFPFPKWDDTLELSADALAPFVSAEAYERITAVWESPVTYPYYLHVVRVVSGAAKHWELRSIVPQILAIQPFPESRTVIEVPAGHFEENDTFEWEGPAIEGCRSAERLVFGDISHRPATIPSPPDPDTVFRTTATYVQRMIEALEME